MTNNKIPIWEQIEKSVEEIPGWSPIDELYSLYLLSLSVSSLKGDFIEIGSWCGRSSIVLGHVAKLINSKLHCIDLFPKKEDWYQNENGDYSFKVNYSGNDIGAYEVQNVHKKPFEEAILPVYEKFGSIYDAWKGFIDKEKLNLHVSAHFGNCSTFFSIKEENFKIKLAFLDGDHSYEALCKDIDFVEKYLVPSGIICFDDAYSGHYPGVDKAIQEKIIDSDKYEWSQQMTRKFFVAKKR